MKKNIKKLIKGALISATTLLAGFIITLLSFKLIDYLTLSQTKLLFTFDFICLIASGAGVYLITESKRAKEKREKEFQKRHFQRMSKQCRELQGMEKYLNFSDSAA